MTKYFEKLLFVVIAISTFAIVNKLGTFSFLKPKPQTISLAPTVAGITTDSVEDGLLSFTSSTPRRVVSWPTISNDAFSSLETSTVSGKFTIALYGDSMIDTMGDLSLLKSFLQKRFPRASFALLNYGIGGQTIGAGLSRFSLPLSYEGRSYPSIHDLRPDIIILGSFAYNLEFPFNRDDHWQKFAALAEKAKVSAKKVYILAEIAPLFSDFAKGTINWEESTRQDRSTKIKLQLENAIGIASTLHIPLINAYELTKDTSGFGSYTYTSKSDGIHPNSEGHLLIAKTISASLNLSK